MRDIANDHPGTYVRYWKGLGEYKKIQIQPRTERPKVIWLYGKTGAGKTHTATHNDGDDVVDYFVKDGSKWWDGYEGQTVVIFEDFDANGWTSKQYRDFLRWTDNTTIKVQTKGGYTNLNSPYMYVTCEYPPSHFWQDNKLAQVTERLFEIRHMTGFFKRWKK